MNEQVQKMQRKLLDLQAYSKSLEKQAKKDPTVMQTYQAAAVEIVILQHNIMQLTLR